MDGAISIRVAKSCSFHLPLSPMQYNSAAKNSHGKKVRHLIGFPEMAPAVASIMELRVEVAVGPRLAQAQIGRGDGSSRGSVD